MWYIIGGSGQLSIRLPPLWKEDLHGYLKLEGKIKIDLGKRLVIAVVSPSFKFYPSGSHRASEPFAESGSAGTLEFNLGIR